MSNKYIIAIDGGTQSIKISIYDLKGNSVCQSSLQLRPLSRPKVHVALHPDDDLWDSIVEASQEVMRLFPYDPQDIIGIGLCTVRSCRALLKEDGSLASPIQSWMDKRLRSPYEHTDPNVKYVTTSSGYTTLRFTGERKDTAANHYGPWPMDYVQSNWIEDQDEFERFNVKREMLFEVIEPGGILGYVTQEAAQETGVPEGIPVIATASDKAVEALSAGLAGENIGLISLGTYVTSMVSGKEFIKNSTHYWTNMACIPKTFLYESYGVPNGMNTVSWLRDLLGDEVALRAKELGISAEELLNKEAENVPAGCYGLITVPNWLVLKNPYGRGIITGFEGRHKREHLYRSIIEGLSFNIVSNMTKMLDELDINLNKVIVTGGGANSNLFMQIISDILGKPTVRN
ncbi:MAG: sugar kinase, partial [Clostridia bacterium]|nr:sugar kinase [Clostridia bacterium]